MCGSMCGARGRACNEVAVDNPVNLPPTDHAWWLRGCPFGRMGSVYWESGVQIPPGPVLQPVLKNKLFLSFISWGSIIVTHQPDWHSNTSDQLIDATLTWHSIKPNYCLSPIVIKQLNYKLVSPTKIWVWELIIESENSVSQENWDTQWCDWNLYLCIVYKPLSEETLGNACAHVRHPLISVCTIKNIQDTSSFNAWCYYEFVWLT